MSARRALVAVLLALFVALSPLLGDMPAGGAEAAGRATIDQPGAQPAAAGRAETRAVLPLPTALPSVQDSVETPESLPLTAACIRHPQHSRWVAVCMDMPLIPHSAAQCYMDHPHHAPPSQA